MKEILNKLPALTVLKYSCTIYMNDIQSFLLWKDVVSLKTEQIQKVNEDDSCLYIVVMKENIF